MKLQMIEAGEIVTTHGVKGEVKVLPWLDTPEDLCGFSRCRVGGKEYAIASCRVQKTCNLLKLSGVDTMEAAQALRGKKVELYRADIGGEVVFAAELIGMDVFSDGKCLGKISEVLDYPGNKVYVVKGTFEYMIPAVSAFILHTDLKKNDTDYAAVLALYESGVLTGSDDEGSFLPDQPLIRAEACTMIARLVTPELRAAPQTQD